MSADDGCIICMDETKKDPMIKLACDHFFHENCIGEWLWKRESTEMKYCPLCRKDFLSLLYGAVREGNTAAVRLLLEVCGTDIYSAIFLEGNAIGSRTLIHVAVEAGHMVIVLIIMLELLAKTNIGSVYLALVVDNACSQKTGWRWRSLCASVSEVAAYGSKELGLILLDLLEGEMWQRVKAVSSRVFALLPGV